MNAQPLDPTSLQVDGHFSWLLAGIPLLGASLHREASHGVGVRGLSIASRQSLGIYSRLAIGEAQAAYDEVIRRFPV